MVTGLDGPAVMSGSDKGGQSGDSIQSMTSTMSTRPPCPQCQSEYTYEDGDHDIDCRIDGIGAMKLKSEFVKKA